MNTTGRVRVRALLVFALALLCAAGVWAAPFEKGTTPPPGWWPWPDRRCDITHTWLDAFNFLDLVPGPAFIPLFVVYAAVVILLCRWIQGFVLDAIEPLPPEVFDGRLPFTLKPNYLELAYLRGDTISVVEAAACSLYRLNLIDEKFRPTSRGIVDGSMSPIESAVYLACANGTEPGKISMDPEVRVALENFTTETEAKFRRAGFLPTEESWFVYAAFIALALLLIEGLAYVRLQRSLIRGFSNVEILVLLMGGSAIVAAMGLYRGQSRFAKRYLAAVRRDCEPALRRMQSKLDAPDSAESIYVLAAFGAGALSGTTYDDMRVALRPPSSDGSCSGCSGGGCGGGGCGGGGCGGG